MTTSELNASTCTSAVARGRIVIIGGGFAGFWAALAARRTAGQEAEITLVSFELPS